MCIHIYIYIYIYTYAYMYIHSPMSFTHRPSLLKRCPADRSENGHGYEYIHIYIYIYIYMSRPGVKGAPPPPRPP